MSTIEVHIELNGALKRVGTLRRQARRGGEATTFEYHAEMSRRGNFIFPSIAMIRNVPIGISGLPRVMTTVDGP